MEKIQLKPGTVHFSKAPCGIQAVVTFGMVLTAYDKQNNFGGSAHYLYPFRLAGKPSTALYGAPAIVGLLKAFEGAGSKLEDLEVNLYGVAHPESCVKQYLDNCSNNKLVAQEILDKKNIKIHTYDLGGHRGRKIAFDTSNGETMIAKVDSIRAVDWMLNPDGPVER